MIPSQTVDDRLRRAFAPTQGGIVGLTDQLLEACVGSDVEFKRVGDRCVCHWTVNGETQEALVPLPPAAFRTILARIAALCNEYSPNAVTPYGGEGLLTVKGPPPTVVRVAFVNTPDEQRLEVRRNAEGSHRPSVRGGPDAASGPRSSRWQPSKARGSPLCSGRRVPAIDSDPSLSPSLASGWVAPPAADLRCPWA